ncbi:uncharacterized protein LOC130745341 [Lotus japonicus]|uniref:uncharacterized protein LOC130745341 n=1 Tax=Lotus japonicus TaxID=34305 RepID=UPI00258F222D|nr:uncharacterized protein LOC130745341 [Lotus japonicus]
MHCLVRKILGRGRWRWIYAAPLWTRGLWLSLYDLQLDQDSTLESQSHLFMTCNWTRGLWLSSHLALRTGDFRDGLDAWVLSMKKVLPADEFDNFIMILWGIWKARNDSVFNKTKPDSQQVVRMALVVRHDWLEHQVARGSRIQEEACWNPPSQGYLKINVDAGWSGKEGTGYGLVARNAKGIFHVAASLYVDHPMDPLMVEALCFR